MLVRSLEPFTPCILLERTTLPVSGGGQLPLSATKDRIRTWVGRYKVAKLSRYGQPGETQYPSALK